MIISVQRRANLWLGTFLLGCGVLYNFPPQDYHFYPLCPFYALTHLLCPGCGGTRALYQLLHLNLSAAWNYNALVTVAAPLFLAWFAFWYYSLMRHGRSPAFRMPRAVMVGLYVLVVLFAVARNMGFGFSI
ncbi:MAG: DUF2752 domain-containing protein [Acidobacteriia bacterium]|nr:DUF2752 domain-containing protein [Terriglobia bacterium]